MWRTAKGLILKMHLEGAENVHREYVAPLAVEHAQRLRESHNVTAVHNAPLNS
jgi:hypothetical protein